MKRYKIFYILVAFLLLAGCATTTTQMGAPKSFAQMSYLERATYFQEMYNKQYDDTESMGKMTTLSPSQLKIYNIKKDILVKAKPLIRTYRAIVVNGGIPEPGKEQEINNLINQLLSAGL